MPQFDQIESFAGQIFWLIVFFTLLYGLMAKLVLPRIAAILDARTGKIQSNMEDARRAHKEAEALLATANAELDKANGEARDLILKAEQKIAEDLATKSNALEEKLDQKLSEAEAEINANLDQAIGELTNLDAAAKAGGAKGEVAEFSSKLASDMVQQILGKKPTSAELKQAEKALVN